MSDWVYVLTERADFPSPNDEVANLIGLQSRGMQPYLLLANKKTPPPGVGARVGDRFLLCLRPEKGARRVAVAEARVIERALRLAESPTGLEDIYPGVQDRYWLAISIDGCPRPMTEEEFGLDADDFQFFGSRAYVKRIRR